MYAWIDGEDWAADGQPALTEKHGNLVSEGSVLPRTYGRLMTDEECVSIARALLLAKWSQPELEFELLD